MFVTKGAQTKYNLLVSCEFFLTYLGKLKRISERRQLKLFMQRNNSANFTLNSLLDKNHMASFLPFSNKPKLITKNLDAALAR